MTCSSCGHSNRAGRRFCANCGIPLAVACPTCGSGNEPGERFCGECGTSLIAPPLEAAAAPSVERRRVSILFADLVGFTSLAETRDAEDVREQLTRYFDVSRQVVERYGGTIEKFIGDAVMAVWGTPSAREDDAERAVRAALELLNAVAALGAESGLPGLAARAAVVTGEAAVTVGAEGQGMVAGDLVNTASRIQSLADAGAVLVVESTMHATEAAVAYADAGVHALKGKSEPLPLWRALRVTAGRGGALKSAGLEPPFVGRDGELRLLKELFHTTAADRKAHVVSVVGIAGIGKSRLSWELYKYLDGIADPTLWHRGRCLAYGEGVAYWALAEMVRMRAGIAEGEDDRAAREKLGATLESVVGDADERAWIEPRLAHLLALEERREWERGELHAAWRLFFERLAETAPVALVFEDMQWADAALVEFVAHLLEWSRNHAIFVLMLARPEVVDRHPDWQSKRRSGSTIMLEPLGETAMEALLDGVVPGLPADLRARILAQAEGVPLYAVETVRMLITRGLLERDGELYRPAAPIDELEVPETLHALLAARLDGLTAEERQALQDAAVLGKTFTQSALAAVSGVPAAELEGLLAGLVRKEVLTLQSDPRSPERGQYGFLQDLLRQVAYETLARRERKLRHLAAAAYLERESVDEAAEVVAAHYVGAYRSDPDAAGAESIRDRAAAALIRAGERAASLGATEEAQRAFEQAIELTEGDLRRAELHERAGRVARYGDRTAEARTHLEQSIALFESLGLTHQAARVRAELAKVAWDEHRIQDGVADMERAYAVLSGDEPDADVAMLAAQLGRFLYFGGRPREALAPTERALEIAEALELPEVLSHALNTKGLVMWGQGRKREGTILLRYALELALEHDLVEAALRAYRNYGAILNEANRYVEALALSREAREYARRLGNRAFERNTRDLELSPLSALGEWDAAVALVAEAAADGADAGAGVGPLTDILVLRGELAEARQGLVDFEWARETEELQLFVAFRCRESMILLAEGRHADAQAVVEEALLRRADLGNRQMEVWVLSAALEAAAVLADIAKLDELLGIIEQFTPGETTRYMQGIAARFSALRAALGGEAGGVDPAFAAAAAAFREISTPFELAQVELEHAEWLLGQGRAEDAEPLLAEAREIFERLRARPWLERLDAAAPAAVIPRPARTID